MISILGKIPPKVFVACSGGPDSMAVVDFLKRSGREVSLIYFNHGTEHGYEAQSLLEKYSFNNDLELHLGQINRPIAKGESQESFWRNQRYGFFRKVIEMYHNEIPLITCHHLDDQVETWLFSSIHGNPRLIPYKRNGCIIRPFLLTRKAEFESWCLNHDVPYLTDPSNQDTAYMRNHIRHNIVPQILIVNPGIHKTVWKKTRKEWVEQYKND